MSACRETINVEARVVRRDGVVAECGRRRRNRYGLFHEGGHRGGSDDPL
jgi:hypothetical protein